MAGVKHNLEDDFADVYEEAGYNPDGIEQDDAELLFSNDDDDSHMDEDPVDGDMVAMVDVLQTLGVEPVCALRFAVGLVRRAKKAPTLVEVYGRGKIVDAANSQA